MFGQLSQDPSPLPLLHHTTQPKIDRNHNALTSTPILQTTSLNKNQPNKEVTLNIAQKNHHTVKYKVYCDGSCYQGGVGAAVILYKNNRPLKTHRFKLGTAEEHTVYEAELVGIILMLYLLTSIIHQITRLVIIGLDTQAAIWVLTNQTTKPSHYLLDLIIAAAEKLQEKQDKIPNTPDFCKAK